MPDYTTCVVVPNWNGKNDLPACLNSLLGQVEPCQVIVVENGSSDGSLYFLQKNYPEIQLVINTKNLGFAGGVNSGIRRAIALGAEYVALFNNDAVADKHWLEKLVARLVKYKKTGIVTGKFISAADLHIDSTGECLTNWGLPYPRGRGEKPQNQYDDQPDVFGASGGASLYRVSMLKEIGLFDEDFFAYYEDVDISFRAQLAGWKVKYVPEAVAYHQIGATSSKIEGFTTYQTMKNLPLVVFKNMPRRYLWQVGWRQAVALTAFFLSAAQRGQLWPALKGSLVGGWLLLNSWPERRRIQKTRKVSDEYIWSIITHDLPPNASKLRALRAKWWKLRGKS